ncbi:bifunctional diguanylate cyclase/phosphodiesterase [Thiomicrospira sp. S5]|uniref:bifunctional diguanylate cyclase/phosphodiesterase n=1 Tax=Thiomicrospira sp. S5 TaxID=1803865 RepID=UPI000F8A18D9|nr:bifunctional diguanylate cyclase/phosphodiesterase [Thiomicrospira sp. S5]AZR81305.1 hypothetical protein AYJ59_02775 [Thiomicrospira sp. S5]AZR81474.1 hypothetical protein AYJ59_03745 [Thiomicrospira sp. S5]
MTEPQLQLSALLNLLTPLPAAVAVADCETGEILYVNPQAEKLFGRGHAELAGKPQTILHPKNRPNTFHQHQKQLREHHQIEQTEDVILTADGQELPVEITANLLEQNTQCLMVAVFTPIKQRQQALKALTEKTQEYEALFNNSQVGIMLLKGYRILHQANQRLAEILGYDTPEEMIGLSMEALHLSKERFEAYGKDNYDTLSDHKNLHVDYELRRKDGSPVWCRLSGMALDKSQPADLSKGVVWVVDDISDIKATETNLNLERQLFQDGPTVIFRWRPEPGWPVEYVSPNVQKTFGYPPDDFLSHKLVFADLIHPDDLDKITQEFKNHQINRRHRFEQTYQLKTYSGEYRKVYDYSLIEYAPNGDIQAIYGYLIDMTDYLKAQEFSRLLLSTTNEGILGIDTKGRATFVNPAALKMLGYEESELIGQDIHTFLHHTDETGAEISPANCRIIRSVTSGKTEHGAHDILWRKDGSHLPVEYHVNPIRRNNQVVGGVITFHDISYRRAREQRIKYLAFHDDLTGLFNRRFFNEHLQKQLKQASNSSSHPVLMMLDIDHFKDINDTLGHPVGDELLKAITKRIGNILRPNDIFARLGGDEFAILMQEATATVEATQLAERILELFKRPFQIRHLSIPISTSIGIAFCEPQYSADDIISQADIALYEAKYNGRNNFIYYEPEMSAKVHEDVKIYNELKQAIQNHSFQLYYQPQIHTQTEKVIGIELLLRWFPKADITVPLSSPSHFIPVAETRGMIHDITLWQFGQLVKEMQAIQAAGLNGRIAINISGELLSHIENLVELLEVIEHNNLSFEQLAFEITETAYAKLSSAEISVLESLEKQGLEMGIDDFGTGYSSLVSLRQFHSSHLKIDKAFIDEVHCNADDYAIVSATISMAHALGKQVIAEGVETQEQLKVLKELNCDIIQGYYYAKPMPLKEVCDFIQNHS